MYTPEPEPDRAPLTAGLRRELRARYARITATPLGANTLAVAEALLYLALILLVAWLWATPEADFRYWGF